MSRAHRKPRKGAAWVGQPRVVIGSFDFKRRLEGVIARFVQNRTLVPAVQPDDCIGWDSCPSPRGIGATGLWPIPAVRRAVSKRRQAQRGLSLTDDYLPDFPEVTGARASGERSASRSRNSIAAETSMPLPDLSSRTKTGAHHERDLEKLSCRC